MEVAGGDAGVGPIGEKAVHGGAGDGDGDGAAWADASGQELEDVGDVALAAVLFSRRPTPEEAPPLSPPSPSPENSDQGPSPASSLAEEEPVGLPPGWEFTLEYYEAKARYLAAQEAAHGASAAKIQARRLGRIYGGGEGGGGCTH